MQSTKTTLNENEKAATKFIAHIYFLFFIALPVLSASLLFGQITFQFFIGSLLVLLAIDAIFTGIVFIGTALLELANNIKTESP